MLLWLHCRENRRFRVFSIIFLIVIIIIVFLHFLSSRMKLAEMWNSFNEADEYFPPKFILFSIVLLVIEYWLYYILYYTDSIKKGKIYHIKYDFTISIISVNKLGQLISHFRYFHTRREKRSNFLLAYPILPRLFYFEDMDTVHVVGNKK